MKVVKTILLSALVAFILFFIGFQIYSAVYSPYKIETVSEAANEKKISVNGIFMRTEQSVEVAHQGYIVHYIPSNGEKVGIGQTIAELYASQNDVINYDKIKQLKNLLEILSESQDQSSTFVTNADQITTQINSKIKELSNAVYSHDSDSVENYRNDLQILLNRRNIITEKETDFSAYIKDVNGEIDSLSKKIKTALKRVYASINGNFVLSADGFEKSAVYGNISTMSASGIESFIKDSRPDKLSENTIGKLITDFDWYYAMILPIDEKAYNESIKAGTTLRMRFNDVSDKSLTVTVAKTVIDSENKKMAVFVKSNQLTDKFCYARKEKADIIFSSVKGYKIKKSAVRIIDDKKGVFVVIGKQMFFRKIKVIYEEDDYVICGNVSGNDTIKPFDDVIVKGTNLYDGKNI